jgi:hypothetical protein
MATRPVSANSEKIEALKCRMGECARAGKYEQAESVKREIVLEMKKHRENAIKALIDESEAQDKRVQLGVKVQNEDLENACRAAIVEQLRRYKTQVDNIKKNFLAKKSTETEDTRALVANGPRPSRKYIELKQIERIKAHEGDFRGARIQQQLAEHLKVEDSKHFENALKQELAKKIKMLKHQMHEEIKILKQNIEEHVDLIETQTKEKQNLIERKSKVAIRRSVTTKSVHS